MDGSSDDVANNGAGFQRKRLVLVHVRHVPRCGHHGHTPCIHQGHWLEVCLDNDTQGKSLSQSHNLSHAENTEQYATALVQRRVPCRRLGHSVPAIGSLAGHVGRKFWYPKLEDVGNA